MVLFDDDVLFNEEGHQYRDKAGNEYPSVTTVLKPWSLISKVPESVLEAGRERGEIVHAATHLDDEGDLDELSVEPEIMAYVRGWRLFRQEWQFKPSLIERRMIHAKWGYAGTIDRFGAGTGPTTGKRHYVPLDIKTGQEDPTHSPQVAAYMRCLVDAKVVQERECSPMTVYLQPDNYRVVQHTMTEGWGTFVAALTWHRWRKKYDL